MSDVHEILKLAAQVVLLRKGDITTPDGDLATTDINTLLRLDYTLAETFNLTSDDVNFENIDDLLDKIDWMASAADERIKELEQQLKTAHIAAFKAGADFWAQCELDEAWHRDEDEAAEEYANNLEGK